ncbi:7 transmembrane receptor (rhodopsin family) domain-containing protein [Ditylenchus destructor]|uniref:7 transmembrane receptor (Rhodopsin family) domain-containing protein n=1 Tax=Ditylenchus destructor TaxID=166010 RepID=A0AAD4MVF8_9BILA|nr:7 transmembrane receptor (rhodopsin family) domain-containing protein [Ditylenchus destructor]
MECAITTADRIVYGVIYPILVLIGLLANFTVILVILSSKKMRHASAAIFPLNLAIADILFIATVSLPKAINWINWNDWTHFTLWDENCQLRLRAPLCPLMYFLLETAYYVSTLTFYAICAQRYISIMYPFQAQWICSTRRILLVVALLWLVFAIHESHHIFRNLQVFTQHRSETIKCSSLLDNDALWYKVTRFVMDAIWYTLFGVTMFFYLRMFCVLRKNCTQNIVHTKKKKAMVTLTHCLLVFIVCQLPEGISDELRSIFGIPTPTPVRYAVLLLSLINNILNPFLYSILSSNFKDELTKLVCRFKKNFGLTRQTTVQTNYLK